eukprot:jgi/Mesvir1/23580/Mv18272-RA.2
MPGVAGSSPRTPLPSYMDVPPVTMPRLIKVQVDKMKDWLEWTVEKAGSGGYPLSRVPIDYKQRFDEKLDYKSIGVRQLKDLVGYMSDVVTLSVVAEVPTLFHKTKKLPVKRDISPPKKPVPTGWGTPASANPAPNPWANVPLGGANGSTPRGSDRGSTGTPMGASSTGTPGSRPGPAGPRRVATGWESDDSSGHDFIPTVWDCAARPKPSVTPCAEPYVRKLRRWLPKAIKRAGKDGFTMSGIPMAYATEFGEPLDLDKAGVKKLAEIVDMVGDLFDKVFEKGHYVLRLPEKPAPSKPRPPRPVEPGEVTVLNRAPPQPPQPSSARSGAGRGLGAGGSIGPMPEATLALREELVDNVAALLRIHMAGVDPQRGRKVADLERIYQDEMGKPLDYAAAGFGSVIDLLGEDQIAEVCRTEPRPWGGGIMYPVTGDSRAAAVRDEPRSGGGGSGGVTPAASPMAPGPAGNGGCNSAGGPNGYGLNRFAQNGYAQHSYGQNGHAQNAAPDGYGAHGYAQNGRQQSVQTQILPASAALPNKPVAWTGKLNGPGLDPPGEEAPTQPWGQWQPTGHGAVEDEVQLADLLLHD